MRLPPSLFGRTALTVAAAFILMQALVLAVAFFTVMRPMAQRSADDLAALLVLAAQTWVELPPGTRPDFRTELASNHQIWLGEKVPPADGGVRPPYAQLLEASLEKRTGTPVRVTLAQGEELWLWTEIPAGGARIPVGIPQRRIGAQPFLALSLVLGIGTLLSLLTALLLVRRLTRPLERLTQAVERVGGGEVPAPLPETGSRELATLARSFNRMARQVRELLDNRTTLLAGISHDLRTPLARLRLALEMLAEKPRPELIARMGRDLEDMNRLIGEFLALARGLKEEGGRAFDAGTVVAEAVAAARAAGADVDVVAPAACACRTHGRPLALRRILDNLIGNALRYGGGRAGIDCGQEAGEAVIRVLDRGPGIAPDQFEAVFRPFHRIEASRSSATGGSGLGLAIALQLAEANGWRLALRNRDGGGLEVRLILPQAAGEASLPPSCGD
jgi:two-component system osmolarity sensor histidine kinase EnvZ